MITLKRIKMDIFVLVVMIVGIATYKNRVAIKVKFKEFMEKM